MHKILPFSLLFGICWISCSLNKTVDINSDLKSNYSVFDYIKGLSSEDYYVLLDSVKNETSDRYFTLRMAYTKTKDYAPYGTDSLLIEARNLLDSARYKEALDYLKKYQEKNWIDISSHMYCGYICEQFGDTIKSKYHYKIYNGLLNSIYISGDGKKPKTAYIVISTKEEYEFMSWFNLQLVRQSLLESDGYSYDLMETKDRNRNKKYDIYFNIELPFSYLGNELGI